MDGSSSRSKLSKTFEEMFHESLRTALTPPEPNVLPELFPWLKEQWIPLVEESLKKCLAEARGFCEAELDSLCHEYDLLAKVDEVKQLHDEYYVNRMSDSKKIEVLELIGAQRKRILMSFKNRLEVDLAKRHSELESIENEVRNEETLLHCEIDKVRHLSF